MSRFVSQIAASRRFLAFGLAAIMVLAACSTDDGSTASSGTTRADAEGANSEPAAGDDDAPVERRFRFPPAPSAPDVDAPNPDGVDAAIDAVLVGIRGGAFDPNAVRDIGRLGDARHAWLVSDLLRFFTGAEGELLVSTFESLTGVDTSTDPDRASRPWNSVTNHLIAWDTPAYPGYRTDKGALFSLLEPAWEPFFADADSSIDWRLVSWGGVFIDDRPLGDTERCPGGCIPALDDPAVTDAAGGAWYPDERIVFGIIEGDEALAIPLHIAEIHEMFNLTLGGRRLGIPYCTLCGSAQAYYTDVVQPQPVLRTSGLLSRSNKVMYDLDTSSVFDTFTGAAVSGPLREVGVVLPQTTVVRSTWGEWKRAHPNTTIIAEDGGIGRSYDLDPLGGRDDAGPIFPIGDADERLDVQALVVGVITADGTPAAFPADAADAELAAGGRVELAGIELRTSGDGLTAFDTTTGEQVAAHEAFWFAWSQFHPDTELWTDA